MEVLSSKMTLVCVKWEKQKTKLQQNSTDFMAYYSNIQDSNSPEVPRRKVTRAKSLSFESTITIKNASGYRKPVPPMELVRFSFWLVCL